MNDENDEIEAAAGLAVRGAARVPGAKAARARLVEQSVPALLMEKDPMLWGESARADAEIRLGWLDTFRRSRDLLPRLGGLREELAELDHVVLAGMGGSSLAAEVIARTLGVELTIVDTTDPHRVRAVLADRLERTLVVIASKSGSTVETDAHRRAYQAAFAQAGIAEVGRRFIVVTDPGSPLALIARDIGAHLILADPDVGGRFSALTAFGLVPSALAGVKVAELLDQADEFAMSIGRDDTDNPALALGAALAAAAAAGRDKLALIDDGTGITGLGDWIEQLIAESTGKHGTGLLPVVVETPTAPGATGPDVLTATFGGALAHIDLPGSGVVPDVSVNGPLGAQFLVWEAATAFASRLLGVNPFDQPNVQESKDHTGAILTGGLPAQPALFADGPIEVYGDAGGATSVADALAWLLDQVQPGGYLAIMAFLDRIAEAGVAQVRPALARASDHAVTFGWGPRFLHSTGQFHKGGPQVGAFLQITGAVVDDVAVPGRPYTFAALQAAQAAGDRQALAGRGRVVLRLHLTDREAGVAELVGAAAHVPARRR